MSWRRTKSKSLGLNLLIYMPLYFSKYVLEQKVKELVAVTFVKNINLLYLDLFRWRLGPTHLGVVPVVIR